MNYSNQNNLTNRFSVDNMSNFRPTKNKANKKNIKKPIMSLLLIILIGISTYIVSSKILNNDQIKEIVKISENISDKTSPSFSEVTIYSNNINNKRYASRGDTITLRFKSDEELNNNPKVKINNLDIDVVYENGYYYASYMVTEQFDNDFLISFNISNYEDKNGNKGNDKNSTTDNSLVYIKAKNTTIEKAEVESVSLSSNTIYLKKGTSKKITPIIKPINATYDTVYWTSENTNIASVDNGNIIANNIGTTKVNVNVSNHVASIVVNVIENEVKATKLTFYNITDSLYVGEAFKINTTIEPYNTTNTKITWSSSDENIATIKDGIILAKKQGKVKITGTIDNITKSKEITIKEKEIELEKLSLNISSKTLTKESTYQLYVSVTPYNYSTKDIKWSSSDKSIAIVNSSGLVTAKSKGTTTITATLSGKKATATISVIENKISVENITFTETSKTIKTNEKFAINYNITPSTATNKNVTWKSSNTTIATVDNNGIVTGKSPGSVTISGTTEDNNKTSSIVVNVINPTISVTSVTISPSSKTLNPGNTTELAVTINPSNASNKNVTWSSSNTNVATVNSNGVVTAKSAGTTTISVKTSDGAKTATSQITVVNPTIPVTGVTLNATSGTKYLNDKSLTIQLTATVSPSNASNKSVTWSSSNTSVATVSSSGMITAKSPGYSTITVKTNNGSKTATYNISVKKKVIIVIGASQVTRMTNYVSSWTSSNSNYIYTKTNKTLNFVNKSGTGFSYQTGDGWTATKNILKEYSSLKQYVEFYIFFPMPGNDIKNFACSEISKDNTTIKNYAKSYNQTIENIKSENYNVKAFVTSVQPVRVVSGGNSKTVVNTNSNSCTAGYRSKKNIINLIEV